MKKILLTLCIPTYNRVKYLKETLDSIETKNIEDIEICISDNNSVDNTENFIKEYIIKSKFKIKYERLDKNYGADLNYMNVVRMANGEYCWFLGSDDVLAVGAIDYILNSIKSKSDIYLCNRFECDLQMRNLGKREWLKYVSEENSTFELSDEIDLIDYISRSTSLGAIFSYLSSIIFKRERWNQYPLKNEYIGTAYSHVFILMSFMQHGCKLTYINNALVYSRGGNDSFLNEGLARRIMLDIDGYMLLISDIPSLNKIKNHVVSLLKRERREIKMLIQIRAFTTNEEWAEIKDKLIGIEYSKYNIFIIGKFKSFSIILLKINYLIKLLKNSINT